MDHAMAVACQDEVAVPADIHAIQHLPVALIADSFYPAIWIQIQQLRITAAFNVKALRMQARVVYKQDWNSGCSPPWFKVHVAWSNSSHCLVLKALHAVARHGHSSEHTKSPMRDDCKLYASSCMLVPAHKTCRWPAVKMLGCNCTFKF